MKRKAGKRLLTGMLAVIMAVMQLAVAGNVAGKNNTTVYAQENQTIALKNAGFESDIWDQSWKIQLLDSAGSETGAWDTTGASISSFSYASDQWMTLPEDGSASGVKYDFKTSGGSIVFSQTTTVPAGTYTITADGMGAADDALQIYVKTSDGLLTEGNQQVYTGYNNWVSSAVTFTAATDLSNVEIGIRQTAAKKGSWGYINGVAVTAKASTPAENPTTPADTQTTPVDSSLYVQKVTGLTDDFISGMDVSTYRAEKNSGAKYYDYSGNELNDAQYFAFLKSCGVNYIRLRVWNDPTDGNGHSYGAGNCDLENAKDIGKLATDAGMKVLIDFHYSDFWADPDKQLVPKAWQTLSLDEKATNVTKYTEDSLTELLHAGVNVRMVQVGNETNNGICGESTWDGMCKIFSAGSAGVRNVSENYYQDKNAILIALHFADPEKGQYPTYAATLAKNNVDYDVFATSYYPFWHGTTQNLTSVLKNIADKYGKKVMVAETAYIYTRNDGDGEANNTDDIPDSSMTYQISVQGQANSIRSTVQAITDIGSAGIGVFYWEPAWTPVQVYDKSAANAAETLKENKALWEKYGSGWATSYASAYDPDHITAGSYGGSEVDNWALFDFTGHPLETMKMFQLIKTGTTTEKKVSEVIATEAETTETVKPVMPAASEVEVCYNSGDKKAVEQITWNQNEIDSAMKKGSGTYTISGTALFEGNTYPAVCKLSILPKNYLVNGNFEGENTAVWKITDYVTPASPCVSIQANAGDARKSEHCLHFYSDQAIDYSVEQTVTLNKGVYTFGGYLEGGNAKENTDARIFVRQGENTKTAAATISSWQKWDNPEIQKIVVTEDNTKLTFGVQLKAPAKAWGSWDDLYLNKVADSSQDQGGNQTNPGTTTDTKNITDTTTTGTDEAGKALTTTATTVTGSTSAQSKIEARVQNLLQDIQKKDKADKIQVPKNSHVKLKGIEAIAKNSPSFTALPAFMERVIKDILKTQGVEITEASAANTVLYARTFDLQAEGSGNVEIYVGKEYAGNIAIVGHYTNGAWEAQQCPIDRNGNIEPYFASFSPVSILVTSAKSDVELTDVKTAAVQTADAEDGLWFILVFAGCAILLLNVTFYVKTKKAGKEN